MDDLKQLLRASGFRATPGKIALLKVMRSSKRPLSVDEIGRRLDLNVVTLYRALNSLADAGLLLRGTSTERTTYFSYPMNHHHHMVCADCGFKSDCNTCTV